MAVAKGNLPCKAALCVQQNALGHGRSPRVQKPCSRPYMGLVGGPFSSAPSRNMHLGHMPYIRPYMGRAGRRSIRFTFPRRLHRPYQIADIAVVIGSVGLAASASILR